MQVGLEDGREESPTEIPSIPPELTPLATPTQGLPVVQSKRSNQELVPYFNVWDAFLPDPTPEVCGRLLARETAVF